MPYTSTSLIGASRQRAHAGNDPVACGTLCSAPERQAKTARLQALRSFVGSIR